MPILSGGESAPAPAAVTANIAANAATNIFRIDIMISPGNAS